MLYMQIIRGDNRKNDKIDSVKFAFLMTRDNIPTAYTYPTKFGRPDDL